MSYTCEVVNPKIHQVNPSLFHLSWEILTFQEGINKPEVTTDGRLYTFGQLLVEYNKPTTDPVLKSKILEYISSLKQDQFIGNKELQAMHSDDDC